RIVGLPTLSSLLLLDPVTAALTTLSWGGRRHLNVEMTTMSRGAFARGYPAGLPRRLVAPRGANSITEGGWACSLVAGRRQRGRLVLQDDTHRPPC
ncbi:MAG TPA: hypothetical protein VF080_15195, partial [Solirubrobacteraceae bacterium]